MCSLGNVLHHYTFFFKDCGVASAERDAVILLNFGLNLSNNNYVHELDRPISKFEINKIKSLMNRRASHEPVAKIIGRKLFWNSSFYVNSNVLDPRPETEVLVQSVLSNIGEAKNILDLGTGTGCVAISLSLMLPEVTLVASDVSKKALDIARWNAKENGANVEFILSNWFENITQTYDIIVANPPYISSSDFFNLPKDVRVYDPMISLIGGDDGLDCYRKIAKSLKSHLSNKGLAFFEIGFGQKEDILNIFCQSGLSLVKIWKDLNNLERVICVKKDA